MRVLTVNRVWECKWCVVREFDSMQSLGDVTVCGVTTIYSLGANLSIVKSLHVYFDRQ